MNFIDRRIRLVDGGYALRSEPKRRPYENQFLGYPIVIKTADVQTVCNVCAKVLGITSGPFLYRTFDEEEVPIGTYVAVTSIPSIQDRNSRFMHFGVVGYGYPAGNKNTWSGLWIARRVNDFRSRVPANLNPLMRIRSFSACRRHPGFTLFDDNGLTAGTKQRALGPLLAQIPETEIVYAGPARGYAQVAVAYAAAAIRNKKKPVLFLSSNEATVHPQLPARARQLNAQTVVHTHRVKLSKLEQIAHDYVSKSKGKAFLLPFGLRFPGYIRLLTIALTCAIPLHVRERVRRLWIVVGSATTLTALYDVFPNASFCIVQVGRTVYDDVLDTRRIERKYIAPEKFNQNARQPGPYTSSANYDAKIWQFFRKHGRTDDHIWNVH